MAKHSAVTVISALCLSLSVLAHAVPRPHYKVLDLGEGRANDVNNHGVVCGSNGPYTDYKAFIWKAGKRIELGDGDAVAINDSGVVVGEYDDKAVVWKNRQRTVLPGVTRPTAIYRPDGETSATAINNKGQILGLEEFWFREDIKIPHQNGRHVVEPHLFVSSGGKVTDLGDSGIKNGSAISDAAVIVGSYKGRAAVWRNGKRSMLPTPSKYTTSTGRDINSHGVIIGGAYYGGKSGSGTNSVMWVNGRFRKLPDFNNRPSIATSINDRGDIVGTAQVQSVIKQGKKTFVFNNGGQHAVIWRGGKVTDLNAEIAPGAGWVLSNAYRINEHGWITGRGLKGGKFHAFLLVPLSKS